MPLVFVYIDDMGCVGQCKTPPEKGDLNLVREGKLTVLRVTLEGDLTGEVEILDDDGEWMFAPTIHLKEEPEGWHYHGGPNVSDADTESGDTEDNREDNGGDTGEDDGDSGEGEDGNAY